MIDLSTIPRLTQLDLALLGSAYNTTSDSSRGNVSLFLEETVTRYDGRHSSYIRSIARHPGGAAVVPLLGEDVICVAQYRPALKNMVAEIPAGRYEDGETGLQVAARELGEETGLEASSLVHLFTCNAAPCFSNWEAQIYLARGLRPIQTPPTADMPTIVCLVGLGEVESLVANHTLVDAKTIAAMLLTRSLLAGDAGWT